MSAAAAVAIVGDEEYFGVWCPRCKQDALPHSITGCCMWCETRIVDEAGQPLHQAPAGRAHGVGTGENAHVWADELERTLAVLDEPVHVTFHEEPPEHTRRLLATLGATYDVDPSAPTHCCTVTSNRRGLTRVDRRDRGLHVYDPPARAKEEPMSDEIPVPCKIDGCENEAVATHGRYARLCETHAAERKAEEARAGGTSTTRRAPASNGGSSYVERVRALVLKARALDKALKRYRELPEPNGSKAVLDEAIRRVQAAPTTENLDRLAAATNAIRSGAPKREKAKAELEEAMATFRKGMAALTTREEA